MAEKKYKLDEVDSKILKELSGDGRLSFRNIAENLEIADGTVRTRVTRMMESGFLRISALINPFFMENNIVAHIGMELESRTQREAMQQISELPGVLSVSSTAGTYDLIAEVYLESRTALNEFLFDKLSQISGIKTTHTFVSLDAKDKWIEPRV